MPERFYNYITNEWTDDATEQKGVRWFIKVGFAGFNTTTNNGPGYISQRRAENVVINLQTKER